MVSKGDAADRCVDLDALEDGAPLAIEHSHVPAIADDAMLAVGAIDLYMDLDPPADGAPPALPAIEGGAALAVENPSEVDDEHLWA